MGTGRPGVSGGRRSFSRSSGGPATSWVDGRHRFPAREPVAYCGVVTSRDPALRKRTRFRKPSGGTVPPAHAGHAPRHAPGRGAAPGGVLALEEAHQLAAVGVGAVETPCRPPRPSRGWVVRRCCTTSAPLEDLGPEAYRARRSPRPARCCARCPASAAGGAGHAGRPPSCRWH